MPALWRTCSVWLRTAWLRLALCLSLLPASGAMATPATMAGLLRNVERDMGAMALQVSVLRQKLGDQTDGEGPGATVVGIADNGFMSSLRSLHRASQRIERRLGDLRPQLRRLDEARAGEILLAMRVELSALTLALSELAATEDGGLRAQALDEVGNALAGLDGATAAVWTLDLPASAAPASRLSDTAGHAVSLDALDDRR